MSRQPRSFLWISRHNILTMIAAEWSFDCKFCISANGRSFPVVRASMRWGFLTFLFSVSLLIIDSRTRTFLMVERAEGGIVLDIKYERCRTMCFLWNFYTSNVLWAWGFVLCGHNTTEMHHSFWLISQYLKNIIWCVWFMLDLKFRSSRPKFQIHIKQSKVHLYFRSSKP